MSAGPSVTDTSHSARPATSRNERLIAEWEARQAAMEAEEQADPKRFASLDALATALNGGKELTDEERKTRSLASFAQDTALLCDRCDRSFEDGDVAHVKRYGVDSPWGGSSWKLTATCEECVSSWHPSWLENRKEPIPCAGDCGLLISHWSHYSERPPRACSYRCRQRANLEQRRVQPRSRKCETCAEEFTPKRADARYCSSACRQDAYRKRKGLQ